MRRKSNQRITKIKLDKILELVKKAEATNVKDGTVIQEPGSELVPYPDMDKLRIWSRKYFTKGLDKISINRFASDGQTYMTTLIDGLPLFTKMTKSFDTINLPVDEYQLADYLTTIGTLNFNSHWVSGFGTNNYIKTDMTISKWTTGTQIILKFQTSSDITTGQSIIHGEPMIGLEIRDGKFECYSWSQNKTITGASVTANTTYWIRITVSSNINRTYEYSTDNFTTTNYIFSTNEIAQANPNANDRGCYIGQNTSTGWDTPFLGKIDLLNSSRRLGSDSIVVPMESQIAKNAAVETSKPGLWLSNLVAPTAGKGGSWLRHNLIHEDEPIELINNDVIGNYVFSYLQRSEITREGDDYRLVPISYAQHWSPSVESCASHDSCQSMLCNRTSVDPCNIFGKGYTPYQTLVVPVDVDMQSYDLDKSKCINYQFRDGWYEFVMHNFKNHIVGSDWSYTFKLTPNGNGSGNNYGTGDNPEADNGSNGGCVTGTITYTNITSDGIVECSQEVNSCFITNRAWFNPSSPSSSNDQLLDDSTTKIYSYQNKSVCCYSCNNGITTSFSGTPYVKSVKVQDSNIRGDWQVYIDQLGPDYYRWSTTGNNSSCTASTPDSCGVEAEFNINTYCANLTIVSVAKSGQWCNEHWIRAQILTQASEDTQPPTDVNIYLIIEDQKKMFDEQGIAWNFDCSFPRFNIRFSTTPCSESYCTNLLIASNVDINDLGDISKLNELNLEL